MSTEIQQPSECLCIFDLETTDKIPEACSPVQVGALMTVLQGGKARNKRLLNTYCYPTLPMQPEALAVHGIGPDKYRWAVREPEAIRQLKLAFDYCREHFDRVFSCGHNHISFDTPIVERIYGALFASELPQIDTYWLALRMAPKGHQKLGPFYTFITGKEPIDAHDAMADITMVSEIITNVCLTQGLSFANLALELAHPKVLTTWPWGDTHGGKLCSDIPIGFWQWCRKSFRDVPPDIQLTIDTFYALALERK